MDGRGGREEGEYGRFEKSLRGRTKIVGTWNGQLLANIGRPGFGISGDRTAIYIYIDSSSGIGKSRVGWEYRESFNGPSLAKIVLGRVVFNGGTVRHC